MSEARILKFVDFADFRVFSEASIQTMIYTIHKEHISSQYRIPYLKIPTSLTDENHIIRAINTDSFWGTSTIDPARKGEPFTLSKLEISSVLDKIQKIQSRHFSSSDIGNGIDVLQDFVGKNHLEKLKDKSVKPGDGVFVLSNNEKRSVALTDTDSQKIKPYFTTSEISRYLALQPNRYWIIYSDKGVRDNIQSYPGIKKHLNKFKSIITSAYRPYGLHRPRDEHFFNGPKILSIRKTRKPCFSFVEFPCYVSRAFLILKPNEWPESFNYLLGLLNSKVAAFWLYYRGKKQGDQLQIDKEPLQNIPIRTIDFDNPDDKVMHDKMVNLVEQMLDLHKQLAAARIPDEKTRIQREISATDNQIDKLVYGLYGLTEEEIRIVEENK
jgi:adenine-specific DNA-methyltransferase